MGLRRFVDVGAVFAWPQWNQPLQEAREWHTVTGNPTQGIGDWGPYLTFDGANDYVTLNQSWEDQLRFDAGTLDFSVVAWVRRAVIGVYHTIINKEDAVNDGWKLRIQNTDIPYFFLNAVTASGPAVADTEWHCVIAVIDRDTDITVYTDGVPGTPTASVGAVMASTAAPRIGAVSFVPTSYFNGDIAGIFVIPRILSAEECLGIATGKAFDYL